MSWSRVRAWREALRRVDPAQVDTGLSAEGNRAALAVALDALTDEALDAVRARGGEPWSQAVFIAAATVPTAPLEWLAVLLGRGTRVVLKAPSRAPGLAPVLVQTAQAVGLPLSLSTERSALDGADLVVAMGSDETMTDLRRRIAPGTTLVAHGHAFSLAWITRLASLPAVADDAALLDGRGCLSPVAVLTPLPVDAVLDALAPAMEAAELRLPRGRVDAAEAARIRTRAALARVVGQVRSGPGWSLHALPPRHFEPVAWPRSLAVVTVPDLAAARALVSPWEAWLSTVGTDDPAVSAWGHARICAPGQMQRPPLLRQHDGRDWVSELAR